MMNNDRRPTVNYEYEDALDAMVFRATSDIEIGDELFDSYNGCGSKDMLQFWLEYGWVNTQNDYYILHHVSLTKEHPHFELK